MSLQINDKIEWVEIEKLKPNPKNNNRHSIEQIERLAKILMYQGWRSPITVSNRSGFIVTGHARLEAALLVGFKKVPVSYQDFDDQEQEYAHMTADNEIARWAELDWQEFKMETQEMELDPDFFGIKGFDNEKDPAPPEGMDESGAPGSDTVKKAIMIEFYPEHYDEAFQLIAQLREDHGYLGELMLNGLRTIIEEQS